MVSGRFSKTKRSGWAETQILSLFFVLFPLVFQSLQKNIHYLLCLFSASFQKVSSMGVGPIYLLSCILFSAPRVMPGTVIPSKYLLNDWLTEWMNGSMTFNLSGFRESVFSHLLSSSKQLVSQASSWVNRKLLIERMEWNPIRIFSICHKGIYPLIPDNFFWGITKLY